MADNSPQVSDDQTPRLGTWIRGVSESIPTDTYEAEFRQRFIPAWVLSAGLHMLLLLLLSFSMRWIPRGAAVEPNRAVGIVLAARTADHVEYYEGESDRQTEAEEILEQDSTDWLLPSAEQLVTTFEHELPSTTHLQVPAAQDGSGLPDPGSMITGRPPPKRFGSSIQTSVFGVAGTGTNFVYLFDRSASMGNHQGRPLHAAKTELLVSLDELEKIHQFQIIFYNESPSIFNPAGESPRMWWADNRGKNIAQRFVRGISAVGGTKHMSALEMALRLKPDVIFFLTDANQPGLTASQLARLRRLNGGATSIHAIEFGLGPDSGGNNFLRQLAQQHSGQYAYVDVSRLERRVR
ncbi:MAG: hypothetical protein CMJ81_17440 [Planctomycetaceae bacterium]|nr:hypothetical protein [Planctomycetaceae bacterium]